MIAREHKRQVLVQKYAEKRKQLKLAIEGAQTIEERAVFIKNFKNFHEIVPSFDCIIVV